MRYMILVLAFVFVGCESLAASTEYVPANSVEWVTCGDPAFDSSENVVIDFRGSSVESAAGFPVSWERLSSISFILEVNALQPETNVYLLPVRNHRRIANIVPFNRNDPSWNRNAGQYEVSLVRELAGFNVIRRNLETGATDESFIEWHDENLPCEVPIPSGEYISFHGGYTDQRYAVIVAEIAIEEVE